jgi:hypothetical protein
MALTWQSAGNFVDRLWDFLNALEAAHVAAKVVGGNLTIGLGFDLKKGDPDLIENVLDAMGLDINTSVA